MNKAFTLLPSLMALTLSGTVAKAQVSHTHTHHTTTGKQRQQVTAILARQQAARWAAQAPAAKTTTASERLIASSLYNFDATGGMPVGKTDSAAFKYSGDRGSKFNRDMMGYMNPTGEFFGAGFPLFMIRNSGGHTVSGQMSQPDVLADSTTIWNSFVPDLSGGYGFGVAEQVNQTYDSSNRITFCSDQYDPVGTIGSWEHYINTYDVNHNIISSLDLIWNAPNWDTLSRFAYTYDASNRLILDSTYYWTGAGMWTPDYKDTYTYNTAGDLTYSATLVYNSGAWEERSKVFVTYNTDHSVHTDSMSDYSFSGTWEPSSTDSFGYAAGANYWTYYRERSYNGPDVDDYTVTKHVAASGLPDSLYVAGHSTSIGVPPSHLIYGLRAAFMYDSYNNPVTFYTNNYNITDSASGAGSYGTLPTGIGHFYYEPYSTTGIKNVAQALEAVSIYPNPAANELKISRPSAVKGAYTIINFTNALGQTIRSDSMPWMNDTETFSLAGFAPGMYIVTLQNKNGEVLSTQKIIKQ